MATRSWRVARTSIRLKALSNRFMLASCARLKTLSAGRSVIFDVPKKKEIGTWSASEIFASLPAPILFRPFSYFWTCWKLIPICSARVV